MTYRKFWYYWHTRNDSDSRNGWNTSHSGHSGSWDLLVNRDALKCIGRAHLFPPPPPPIAGCAA